MANPQQPPNVDRAQAYSMQFLKVSNPPLPDAGAITVYADSNTGLLAAINSSNQSAMPSSSFPQFASYTFSVTGGVVSARNNSTGAVDFSGADAAVVVNAVLNANATVGGTLYFKNGIYNINSMTQETRALMTMFWGGIFIPYNSLGYSVQWRFVGESRTFWAGELGVVVIQTNGVIFNVTSTALSGRSGSDVPCAVYQQMVPGVGAYYTESNDVFFENIAVRFPTNQTSNLIGFCMYNAGDVSYENCLADFNIAYASIASGSLPASGTIGFTSSTSGAGNWQHFSLTFATGYETGYDIQSEHSYGDTMTSQYCTYAGYVGRGASVGWQGSLFPAVYHPTFMIHTNDQECVYGWRFGGNMSNGSLVTMINYAIESYVTPGGTFTRVGNMSESQDGYSNGYISFSNVNTPGGAYGTTALFVSGGSKFIIYEGGNQNAGLKVIGSTPTVATGQIGLGSTTAATASGGSATLPGNPVGFLEVNIGGTMYKVPYYAA